MRWLPALMLLAACAGGDSDTDVVDSDLPDTCSFRTEADRFSFGDAPVGSSRIGTLTMEMRCPEPTGLTLAWETPTDAFTLEGPTERTLAPYSPADLQVTFSPPTAGNHEGRLILTPQDTTAGGILVRFQGTGTE